MQTESTCILIYSRPSLSGGHFQQRPPSLIRPQILAAATLHVFTSPSQQSVSVRDHLSNVATISWQIGWPY